MRDQKPPPLDRRAFLKTTGAVALGGALAACGDGERGAVRAEDLDAADGTADETRAADSEVAPADTVIAPPDTMPPDFGADTDEPAPDTKVSDVSEPALTPLRGDGSSPLHYIEHIVVVQMENRSFDHYLGALTLLEGRTDVEGLQAEHGNPDAEGNFIPVHPANGLWVLDPDPSHSHGACVDQFADGTNSGFVRRYEDDLSSGEKDLKGQVVSYFKRDELPALYGLADAFTLCDQWHCAILGPTWPNRFFSHAATSDGIWVNLLPLSARTIYANALDAGVSFGVYHQSPVYFALTLLNPVSGSYPSSDLDKFYDDAAAGTLPNVTLVEPDYGLDDDHPPHDIRLGQAYLASVYEALRQSPKWDRTLMLVFYDEHGGFYDHVVPPKPAGGETRSDFDQLGFRVPGIVAGGLAGRGKVMKDLVEHSSVPGLIARTFGLEQIHPRAELAGDLSKALDLDLIVDSRRPPPPALPPIDVPAERLEAAMRGRFRHPELQAFARERGITDGTLADKRARTLRWVERAKRLGVLRVV